MRSGRCQYESMIPCVLGGWALPRENVVSAVLYEEGVATHSSILAFENPHDRGAWQATVHGVKESDTTE